MMKAVIIGATGAIGKEILLECINSEKYNEIYVLGRKSIYKLQNQDKFTAVEVDFENLNFDTNILADADVFCAFGTTIKKAGTKENMKKIDYHYVMNFAKLCENSVISFNVVTTTRANSQSKNYYIALKGKLEEDLKKLSLGKLRIYKPSLLIAQRSEKRFAESIAIKLSKFIIPILHKRLSSNTPIKVEQVAYSMVLNAINNSEKLYYEYADMC